MFRLFVPITKVHEEGGSVFVEGYATRDAVDDRGTAFDYDGAVEAFTEWTDTFQRLTNGESMGNIREMHQKVAAGKCIGWRPDAEERGQYICAEVIDEAAREKCRKRVYTGFSIGANPMEPPRTVKRDGKSVPTYHKFRIAEVSLVDAGGTPGTEFTLVRRAQDPASAAGVTTAAASETKAPAPLQVPRALRFDTKKFTREQATAWAEAHEFRGRKEAAKEGDAHLVVELSRLAFDGSAETSAVALAEGVELLTGALDPASPAARLRTVLRDAQAGILERVRSQGGQIIASLNSLASLVQAIDASLFGGYSSDGATPEDRAAVATLTDAADLILSFCSDAFHTQLASMGAAVLEAAEGELQRFVQIPQVLTPAQLERVMGEDEMKKNVGSMHDIGHALCDATTRMGAECRAGACTATDGAAADDGDKTDDTKQRAAAQAPLPASAAAPAAAVPSFPARTGFPSPGEVAARHMAGGTVAPAAPIAAPAAAATPAPVAAAPQAQAAQAAPAAASPAIERGSKGSEDPVLQAVMQVGEQVKGLVSRIASIDEWRHQVGKLPAPIGRPPAAPVEKRIAGSVAPASDPAAVSAELQRMAETTTDPVMKARLVLRAAELVSPTPGSAGAAA